MAAASERAASEEGGEEGLHLGLVGMDEHGVVGADHDGGKAAPIRAILAVVTLK